MGSIRKELQGIIVNVGGERDVFFVPYCELPSCVPGHPGASAQPAAVTAQPEEAAQPEEPAQPRGTAPAEEEALHPHDPSGPTPASDTDPDASETGPTQQPPGQLF